MRSSSFLLPPTEQVNFIGFLIVSSLTPDTAVEALTQTSCEVAFSIEELSAAHTIPYAYPAASSYTDEHAYQAQPTHLLPDRTYQ